ncbi:hypothetical protein ElyMa_003205700 [Elysia marginata]|uniref:Uncharacterized protein n=1 Tax=Elysia marginata TaxID=1093978 RepID=A0AAV4J379_9GAST|nr:hypothetical protein ElyMa_003205700 [Elysia marginata]
MADGLTEPANQPSAVKPILPMGVITSYVIVLSAGDAETGSIRLTIDAIPLPYSDNEVLDHLKEAGVKLLGPLTLDRVRDGDG